jgi:hypothetical protein
MTEALPAGTARPLRWLGQGVLYALFAAFIGVFSTWPSYSVLAPGQGLLRLSFSHPGKISTDCRQRSNEELAKLAPHLRSAQDCQRARSPVHARVELDGQVLVDRDFAPAGLSGDGASSGYWRSPVTAGTHLLRVEFRDDVRAAAATHRREATVEVREGQIVLVDYKPDQGGVIIR